MLSGRRMLALAVLGICLLSTAAEAALAADAQQTPERAVYHFGVMGQVAFPGVYEVPEANPLLVDVARQAGGLKADANGQIRIVRQLEHGYESLYADNLQFRLQPGDLVIADRLPATAMPSSRNGAQPVSAEMAVPQTSDSIEVAFLNLIDRPVVVKLRSEHATLGHVWTLLGQPAETMGTVRIIGGDPGVPVRSGPETRFQPGTVLVFEPSVIQPGPIPALPSPVPVALARPEAQALVKTADAAPAAPEIPAPVQTAAVEEAPPPPADPLGKKPATAIEQVGSNELWNMPEVELLDAPGAEPEIARYNGPMKSALRSPLKQSADVSVAGTAQDLPASRATLSATAGDPFALRVGTGSLSMLPKATAAAADNSESSSRNRKSAGLAYAVGFLVVLTGVAVLWLASRQEIVTRIPRSPMQHATTPNLLACSLPEIEEQSAAAARTARLVHRSPAQGAVSSGLLDALIRNELPLVEETISLRLPAQIYGRPSGPRSIRIDAAHRPHPAPHFGRTGSPAEQVSVSRTIPRADDDSDRPNTIPQPHVSFAASAGEQPSTSSVMAAAAQNTSQPATLEKRQRVDHSHNQEFFSVLDRALSMVHGARQQ